MAQYGIGDNLLRAVHSLAFNKVALQAYIHGWARRLQDILVNDPLGHIGRRHPRFLKQFPENFPDPSVVLAYVKPPINALPTGIDNFNSTSVQHTSPNILDMLENLAYLCEFYFGWTQHTPPGSTRDAETTGTLGKLRDYVWTGVCLHSMLFKVRALTSHPHMSLSYPRLRPAPGTSCAFTRNEKDLKCILSSSTGLR